MAVHLRRVHESDKDDLWRWRNDPVTRQMSFDTEVVAQEQHAEWFEKLLLDRQQVAFMAEDPQGEKVGVVRFKWLYDQAFEININVAPERRGRGLGSLMIKEGCQKMMAENGAEQFFARVKSINERSVKSFLKAGFEQVDAIGEMIVLRYAR